MNRGLVVNSAPRARVWSPSLAIFVLFLFLPTGSLEAALEYCLELLLGYVLSRSAACARISGS